MDPQKISDLQDSYDHIAGEYAQRIYHELDDKPLDRELLERFAAQVKGLGPVCDMGCGPGHIARYLAGCGVDAFGLDLSPGMVALARQLNPGIPFKAGNMLALEEADASWGGIAAFYSIIHIPRAQVVDALRELKRVLIPGGLLMLAIHIDLGEGVVHVQDFFGKPVSLDFVFFKPEEMEGYLSAAGFERIEISQRQPYPDVEYQGPRAYLFARKPL